MLTGYLRQISTAVLVGYLRQVSSAVHALEAGLVVDALVGDDLLHLVDTLAARAARVLAAAL